MVASRCAVVDDRRRRLRSRAGSGRDLHRACRWPRRPGTASRRADHHRIVNDGTPRSLTVFRITDHPDAVRAYFNSGGASLDWSHAPIDQFTFSFDTDVDQMITLELTPGQWLIEKKPTTVEAENPPRNILVTVS